MRPELGWFTARFRRARGLHTDCACRWGGFLFSGLAAAGCCPSPLGVSFPQGSVYLWVQSTPLPLANSPGPPQEDTNCSAGEDRPVELTTPPTLASGSRITGSLQPVSQRVG